MRIVLLGTTQLSLACFHTLLRMGMDVVGVVTTPGEIKISQAGSRVNLVQHADLVTASKRAGIPVIVAAEKLNQCVGFIQALAPDFLLAVGWYSVVPSTIRNIPPLGSAGVHASLLPKYRGGAPINWALINGEDRTGVTLFYLDEALDSGDIIAQAAFSITLSDTCATLYEQVTKETQTLLERSLPLLQQRRAPRVPQDERLASTYPLRRPEEGRIFWSLTAGQIHNWVRALTRPYPGAFTWLKGQRVMVWKSSPPLLKKVEEPAGTILSVEPDHWIDVAAIDGVIRFSELDNCPWELAHPGSRFSEEAL